ERNGRVVDPHPGNAVSRTGRIELDVPLEEVPPPRLERDGIVHILSSVHTRKVSTVWSRRRLTDTRSVAVVVDDDMGVPRAPQTHHHIGVKRSSRGITKHDILVARRIPPERIGNINVPTRIQ